MTQSLIAKSTLCAIVCVILGSLSGILSGSGNTEWYQNLNMPSFQPPSWIFGPMWTLLYILMGIAAARVWQKSDRGLQSSAIRLFVIQMVLNLAWSPIFFGMKEPLIALVVIVVMWILILLTIISFSKVDKLASYLLVPYISWVSFATILNASVVYLN